MDSGWTLNDVDDSDYYQMVHLFTEVSEEEKQVEAEDFFRTFLSQSDVQKLDEQNQKMRNGE